MKEVRLLKALTLISLPALLLTGCAMAPEDGQLSLSAGLEQSCQPAPEGDGAKQISVSKTFGEQPLVSFPTPLKGQGVERSIVIQGEGEPVVGNQRVLLHFAGYNAATGEEFQASEFGSLDLVPQDITEGAEPDFCAALVGVAVGSRVAVLFDPAQAHGGAGVPSLNIGEADGVIFVFDVVEAYLPRANGAAKAAQAGFPTVILAPNGQPGIQVLATDPATEFARSVLIEGRGEEISIGDYAVVHYSGWTWDGTQFDSSWERASPAEFQVASSGLIEGFVRGLDGVKVGSQVVIVIPPELGYGDSAQGSIPANSTLIFVVDVLGIANK